MAVSFDVSDADLDLASAIAERATVIWPAADKLEVWMDITATHANGNPLRLADLLEADNFNFVHDVGGIRRYLNRETGQLEKSFVPRYSAKVAAT